MANMHLVTGYAGMEHVTAEDQGAFNAALIGTGQFVLKKGNVFEAQIISNNLVRVLDGELMMQGRFVRLNPDTYVDLTIENGTQGMLRNDLLVARYEKDTTTSVESVSLIVIKGTEVASNPTDPTYVEGDVFYGSATMNDFPLWRIPLDGLSIGTPVSLFGEPFYDSMLTLPEIRKQVNEIHNEVDEKIASLESYTKEEVLTDATKEDFGLGSTAVPDDVFCTINAKLKLIMSNVAAITVSVKTASGSPIPSVLVGGVFDDAGNNVYTDSDGVVAGYVAEGSTTLSVSGYSDLVDYSETFDVTKGETYTKEIAVTTVNFLKLTSSKSVKFSGNVSSVDITVVGGGGGGGRGNSSTNGGGGGGGGGACVVQEALTVEPNVSYAATIGKGGTGAYSSTAATAGGTSSFLDVTASGGGAGANSSSSSTRASGGSGNGAGGSGGNKSYAPTSGTQGGTLGYSSFTDTVRYGGGGGGGQGKYGSGSGSGGADYGQAGGNPGGSASSGTGGGGGGGVGYQQDWQVNYSDGTSESGTDYIDGKGGNGGSGCVAIRMNLTAA